MVHPSQQRRMPASAARLATLTITTGKAVRVFRVRGWVLAGLLAAGGVFLPAYIAATAYLVYRDDLLGASLSRQVAIQYAYEDRIAALRAELDRVTSRQIVESRGVEDQVGLLLERQAHIDRRQQILDNLITAAGQQGIRLTGDQAALPRPRPMAAEPESPTRALGYAAESRMDDPITGSLLKKEPVRLEPVELKPVLEQVQSSLEAVQQGQTQALDAVMQASRSEVDRLTDALSKVGVRSVSTPAGTGGPFIPAQPMHFVEKSTMLDQTLKQISGIRRYAAALPLRKPVSGAVSSQYGNRVDPFLGRPALHAGIDFAASEGTEVRATAPGTVIAADWNGGYGQMVEVRHVDGVTTRYAHLSRILVGAGDRIAAGTVVGLVGSTGRSTGAHLHYETRRRGEPVNPALYLAAGRAL